MQIVTTVNEDSKATVCTFVELVVPVDDKLIKSVVWINVLSTSVFVLVAAASFKT